MIGLAMAFGVPAVVRAGTAAPLTGGEGSRVFSGGAREIAEAVHAVLSQRTTIGTVGKARYDECYRSDRLRERFLALLARVSPSGVRT